MVNTPDRERRDPRTRPTADSSGEVLAVGDRAAAAGAAAGLHDAASRRIEIVGDRQRARSGGRDGEAPAPRRRPSAARRADQRPRDDRRPRMTACELFDSADVELYFYGELDPVDRARVERAPARLRAVPAAARRSARDPPRARLAPARRRAAGRRLVRLHAPSRRRRRGVRRGRAEPEAPGRPSARREPRRRTLGTVDGLAAMLALVTIGVLVAMRVAAAGDARVSRPRRRPQRVAGGRKRQTVAPRARPIARCAKVSVEHLERSKLVVLGLATRDPAAHGRGRLAVRARRSPARC